MSNEHTVRAVFTFKDNESKKAFITFCNGERGLGITRAWEGCKAIECYETEDNRLEMTIWQKWASKENHESYIAMRKEKGDFDMLGGWVSAPPDIKSLHPIDFVSDEEKVEAVIRDMCHKDYQIGMKHTHQDCVFIRPTGNPLNMDGWKQMMTSSDVNVESNDLVTINKMQVVGDMAYVCYTTHGKFNYKGTQNDDIAVLTSVLQRVDGSWKVVHGQRSSGRKPEEGLPQFA